MTLLIFILGGHFKFCINNTFITSLEVSVADAGAVQPTNTRPLRPARPPMLTDHATLADARQRGSDVPGLD